MCFPPLGHLMSFLLTPLPQGPQAWPREFLSFPGFYREGGCLDERGRRWDLGTDGRGWAALGGHWLDGGPCLSSLLGSHLPHFLGHPLSWSFPSCYTLTPLPLKDPVRSTASGSLTASLLALALSLLHVRAHTHTDTPGRLRAPVPQLRTPCRRRLPKCASLLQTQGSHCLLGASLWSIHKHSTSKPVAHHPALPPETWSGPFGGTTKPETGNDPQLPPSLTPHTQLISVLVTMSRPFNPPKYGSSPSPLPCPAAARVSSCYSSFPMTSLSPVFVLPFHSPRCPEVFS